MTKPATNIKVPAPRALYNPCMMNDVYLRRLVWLGLAVLLALASESAHGAACDLTKDKSGTVTEIVDGDTLFIDDGTQIRLVGIQAPKLPLGRRGFKPWPLADAAKSVLATLSEGRTLTLSYGGRVAIVTIVRWPTYMTKMGFGSRASCSAAVLRGSIAFATTAVASVQCWPSSARRASPAAVFGDWATTLFAHSTMRLVSSAAFS